MKSLRSNSLILITALLFISCGQSTNLNSKVASQDIQIRTEIYEENEKFFVDEFLTREGAVDQRISHNVFTSQHLRNEFIRNKKKNISSGKSIIVNRDYDIVSSKNIWTVKNNWTLDWESKYSQWVKENFHQNFFLNHNISTDCADVAFVLRWIFARIHSLPAANTLAGSGKIFSQDNFIRKWKRLKRDTLWYKDEVFLAALEYLKNSTYTKTLKLDTYPVKLSKDAFREGVIQLNPTHVRVISQIIYDGSGVPILKQYSTRPTAIRPMAKEVMLNFKAIPESDGGFVKFRWPIKSKRNWKLVNGKDMSWFSKDQYQTKFLDGSVNFTNYLMDTLGIKKNARATISSMLGAVKEFVNQRDEIVAQGYEYCQQYSCDLGTIAYDDWSTPSRDKRVVEFFNKIDKLIGENTEIDPSLKDFYIDLKSNTFVDLQYAQIGLTMMEVEKLFRDSYLSYDPRDLIAYRWAMDMRVQYYSLELKINRLLKVRELKIEQAQVCRDSLECISGTKLFETLNTISLDKELKKYIKNINFLCNSSAEYCLLRDKPDLINISKYQSEPNLSINKRLGIIKESLAAK